MTGLIKRQLLQSYCGLSPALVKSMVLAAGLDPNQSTDSLAESDWKKLFGRWQEWLEALSSSSFHPGFQENGYMGKHKTRRERANSPGELL